MAKKQQQNKIGESFEQQLPDELVPDFIWDNIANTLDKHKIPTESTEKIKSSFEEGFKEEILPPFLWNNIQSSLEQANPSSPLTEGNNKIKSSFEEGHQDLLPENLWENVENQLEIEGVWQRVLKKLNGRTKRRYWQEKGMQFGILALAILLLRGCDFGEWSSPTPIASQSNTATKVEVHTQEPSIVSVHSSLPNTITTSKSSEKKASKQAYMLPATPLESGLSKTSATTNLQTASSVITTKKSTEKDSKSKKNLNLSSTNSSTAFSNLPLNNKQANNNTTLSKDLVLTNSSTNSSTEVNKTASKAASTTKITTNTPIANNSLRSNSSTNTSSNTSTGTANHLPNKKTTNTASKELFLSPISTLMAQPFSDSIIDKLHAFEIHNVANKTKHNLRFELGLNGKVGTSLLLGSATKQAMETTSMIKTKTRVSGGVGLLLSCYLTANDALVFAAYPLSNSQQYFGGYTSEGRYYHKEIKLAYFDFTLGYQRTLFRYNDFGTLPSSMYARIDYGLGYLSKSEEVINGLTAESGNAYNKLNHNIGLTIGNTHRIKRFVIDYGIYANIGLSSVLNVSSSGTSSVEYTNLATMGGYLGLRYVL